MIQPIVADPFGRPACLAAFAVSAVILFTAITGSLCPPRAGAMGPPLDSEVCVTGEECKGVGEVAAAAGGAARAPHDIIAKHCNACHGTGLLGAPKIGDRAAWKERADREGGLEGLLAKAITGVNAMPPKGTCADCSDDELRGAIQEMSGLR